MRYKVTDGTKRHDGKLYEIGAEMEVSEEVAARLRLEPVPEPPPVVNRPNVREMARLVEDCATIAEVEALMEGEERKTVIEAAAKRQAAIEKELEEAALQAVSGDEAASGGDEDGSGWSEPGKDDI